MALLDIEEMQDKLTKLHKTRVGKDDPILMLVTLQNEILQKYDELFQAHNAAVTESLGKQLAAYSDEIKKQTELLLSKSVRSNISNSIEEITSHKSEMRTFLQELRKYAVVCSVCTGLCFICALCFAIFWGRS